MDILAGLVSDAPKSGADEYWETCRRELEEEARNLPPLKKPLPTQTLAERMAARAKTPEVKPALKSVNNYEIIKVQGYTHQQCRGPCKRNLPFSAFYKSKARGSGYDNTCKECSTKKAKKAQRSPKCKARRKEYMRKYMAKRRTPHKAVN